MQFSNVIFIQKYAFVISLIFYCHKLYYVHVEFICFSQLNLWRKYDSFYAMINFSVYNLKRFQDTNVNNYVNNF